MVTVSAMRLDAWIIKEGLTSAAFGELAGIGGKQLVHKYRHGERFPSHENLRRIREATKGAVTSEDFVDQHSETGIAEKQSVGSAGATP